MTIEYDKPIEVTAWQYTDIVNRLGGLIAHRQVNGRFYVKLWEMKYKNHLLKLLK